MGVGFGVGASVGEGRCGAVDLSVELPEEPELLPVCGSVVSGTAAGAGSCVGFGVGSGVGDGVGEGVGVGTSSRRMIDSADWEMPKVQLLQIQTARPAENVRSG
ncbi:MAG: hypothetical protein ACLTXL_16445 [Clostridia bacterium]